MADNSTRLDASAALETLASDDIGGVKYQRMKPTIGADGTAVDVQPPDADGKAVTSLLPAGPLLFNETTWDRQRGNTQVTLLVSAARTVQTTSAVQTNYNARGVIIWLNVSVASGTGGLTLIVQGVDIASGSGFNIFVATAPVTATGQFCYLIYPGATAAVSSAPTQTQGVALPRSWNAVIAVGNATSYTYSLGASLIV